MFKNVKNPIASKADDSEFKKTPKKQYKLKRKASTIKPKDSKKIIGRQPNFPVSKIHEQLNQGNFKGTFSANVAIYLAAIEEYIATEVLELAGNKAKSRKGKEIKEGDLIAVICQDKDLQKALGDCIAY